MLLDEHHEGAFVAGPEMLDELEVLLGCEDTRVAHAAKGTPTRREGTSEAESPSGPPPRRIDPVVRGQTATSPA